MTYRVALIRGDGVGPELTEAALTLLRTLGPPVELIPCEAGYEWWEQNGGDSLIPKETWKILESTHACLKGPTTTPAGPGTPKSVAVSIRQRFDLYANIRPIKTFSGSPGPLGPVDFIIFREATEGLYAGIEWRLTPDLAVALRKVTRRASERVGRAAFEQAKSRGWGRVAAIHKANILKETDGVFLEAVRSVARDYPDIKLEDYFIDNFAQQLVKNPQRFNQYVVVGTNLFMDIISEEASALVASIGAIPSVNLGDTYAMFEPAHGSVPRYKGQNKVNPTGMILSTAWMLDFLGEKKQARAIEQAVEDVVVEKKFVTYDFGGSAGTREMTEAVAKHARSLLKAS